MGNAKMLWKNIKIEEIVNKIEEVPFDEAHFAKKFSEHPRFEDHKEKGRSIQFYTQAAAKIHLIHSLEVLADKYANSGIEFYFPIPDQAKNENFVFYYDELGSLCTREIESRDDNPQKIYLEFTKAVTIKKVPTLINIKTGSWSYGKKGTTIRDYIRPEYYTARLYEVRKYLKETGTDNLSWVVVVPKDTYNYALRSRTTLNFAKNNGLLVPLAFTRERFKKDVEKAVKNYGLKLAK